MRVTYSVPGRKRHKKLLERAKGFRGSRHYRFKTANESVLHAMRFEYRDRRNRKRDFRRLWITRISAFVRENGITYSRFIEGLTKAGVILDRKLMANLAIEDPAVMLKMIELAKTKI